MIFTDFKENELHRLKLFCGQMMRAQLLNIETIETQYGRVYRVWHIA